MRDEYPRFTAYVTTYALTRGILCVQGYLTDRTDGILCYDEAKQPTSYAHGEGKEWHRTFDGAEIRARRMVNDKRTSLVKQIDKLNKMKFHVSAVMIAAPGDDA